MLPRTLEPEAMTDELEVAEYDEMSHQEVNTRFVDDLLQSEENFPATGKILDLGTGTALIPLRLLQQCPTLQITAIDRSEAMLQLAERHVKQQHREGQLQLIAADSCALPFAAASYAAVISNSLIHHLPEPLCCLQEAVRVLQPGGFLFIRDLLRPETETQLEQLVATYAGQDSALQQQLLRQSLHAALTIPEMEECLSQLPELQAQLQITSDRHWTLIAHKS